MPIAPAVSCALSRCRARVAVERWGSALVLFYIGSLLVPFPAMHSSADRFSADTRLEGNLLGWSQFVCATDTIRVCRQVFRSTPQNHENHNFSALGVRGDIYGVTQTRFIRFYARLAPSPPPHTPNSALCNAQCIRLLVGFLQTHVSRAICVVGRSLFA